MVEHFAASHRVIAVDPLGFGLSAKPHDPGDFRESDLPLDIAAVLEAEAIEAAAIWGYSRGARLAYLFAQALPERTSALIAGGAVARSAADSSRRYRGLADVLRRSPDEFFDLIGSTDLEWRRRVTAESDMEAVLSLLEAHVASAVEIDLASIRCPALIYCGGKEAWWEDARDDAERLGADFHLLADKDHGQAFGDGREVWPAVEGLLRSIQS